MAAPGSRTKNFVARATKSAGKKLKFRGAAPGTLGPVFVAPYLHPDSEVASGLAAELTKLSELAGIEALDETQLKQELHERVADVKTLLQQNTTQARQMLQKLLSGSKIAMEGFGEGRERGYKFRGELSIGRLITGGGR